MGPTPATPPSPGSPVAMPQVPPSAVPNSTPVPLGAPNGAMPPPQIPPPMPIGGFPPPNAPSTPPYVVDMQEDGSAIWRAIKPDGTPGPIVKVASGPGNGKASPTAVIR